MFQGFPMKYGSFRYCVDCNIQKIKHDLLRLRIGYVTMTVGMVLFISAAFFGSEPFAVTHISAIVARETAMMLYSSVLILFSMIMLISSR